MHLLQNDACFKDFIFGGEGIHSAIFLCNSCNAFCAKTMIFLNAYRHVINKYDCSFIAVGDLYEELIVFCFADDSYDSVVCDGNAFAGINSIFNGI